MMVLAVALLALLRGQMNWNRQCDECNEVKEASVAFGIHVLLLVAFNRYLAALTGLAKGAIACSGAHQSGATRGALRRTLLSRSRAFAGSALSKGLPRHAVDFVIVN